MTTIGLKQLRENTATYIRAVKAGRSFVVYRRSTPLFKVSPLTEEPWEEVIDFTKLQKGGVNVIDLLKRL